MKCEKCGYEMEKQLNFCPNCGANLNGENPQVEVKEGIINNKIEKKEEPEVLILENPKTNLIKMALQFIFYFCLGMSVVTFFIGVKGFGIIKKEPNPLTVWLSFGICLVASIGIAIFYYIKFMREK